MDKETPDRDATESPDLAKALLWGLPTERIRADVSRGDGDEIGRGRIFSPRSSTALAVNAFGPFFERTRALPPLPGLDEYGWPASRIEAESKLPFPWSKGSLVGVPNLDVLIETATAIIGIESKRFEPWDRKSKPSSKSLWSSKYTDHDWGEVLRGYMRMRDDSRAADRGGGHLFQHLGEAQLVKHAFALHTATLPGGFFPGKTPVLFYVHAEPRLSPAGRPIPETAHAMHRAEVAQFAAVVAEDAVRFHACSYRELLASWSRGEQPQLRAHAAALRAFFDDNL